MNDPAPWTARLHTAGLVVEVHSESAVLRDAVVAAAGGSVVPMTEYDGPAEVTLLLEGSHDRFDISGLELVTRGVWAGPGGHVVLDDVGGSGYTQRWRVNPDHLEVCTRWSPSLQARLAAMLLPARFRALQAQVLLHYPALWWAGVQGRVPLHVSVVEVDGVAVMLAGPGGIGKSTLVARELASGASATCDNLAVSAGGLTAGVCEPLRLSVPGGSGRRTTHGRRELAWTGRVPQLDPKMLVVVRRGVPSGPTVTALGPDLAGRALLSGTYAAGELQRFWPLTAMLALATGRGPAHPPLEHVVAILTSRLPCFELQIAGHAESTLSSLLDEPLLSIHRQEVTT